MMKLAALLAALLITALCALLALYAVRLFVLVLLHWQAMVILSLLFYASVFTFARFKVRQAEREAKDGTLASVAQRRLRKL